ncbi:TPA: hypothetical protein MH691_08450 [Klebsiella pneumoniae]|nr:hypothetical protein DBV09_09020 [Klebsiella pneumoniae]MBF8469240.1 hypothetical protein [Klebsiella oxytoca]HBX1752259.1 hypothetical protein [Klebsiella pneumoniae subsp. pneumoniae]EIW8710516.1 hypothetical protein [Klebsiella pneumoniae]EIW8718100.1 hypothetical protein [Klebsiella pneumoniae]
MYNTCFCDFLMASVNVHCHRCQSAQLSVFKLGTGPLHIM